MRADFQRLLIVDDTLTGFADFNDAGRRSSICSIRAIRHTGLSYSLLAMVHAIIDGLFTPEQARRHLDLIEAPSARPRRGPAVRPAHGLPRRTAEAFPAGGEQHLLRPGDRPHVYPCPSALCGGPLALRRCADGFFRALCQTNPIGIRDRVPAATLRQANCYYSSSDAAFMDRYEAYARL